MKQTIYLFLITYFVMQGEVIACPGCSQLLEFGKDALQTFRFGKGIAWSMLLMFSVPVAMITGLAVMIIRAEKKAQAIERHGNQT